MILSDDKLQVQEDIIFSVLLTWSENQCKAKNLPLTTNNKRHVMGQLLYKVRFPLMNAKQFSDAMVTGILTQQEQECIIKCVAQGGDSSSMFSWKARQGTEYVCFRFTDYIYGDQLESYKVDTEKTCVRVSKNITVVGFVIAIPSDDQVRCAVDADIKQVNGYNGSSIKQTINIKDTDAENRLKVYFNNPVFLVSDSDYIIRITFQHLFHCLDTQSVVQKHSGFENTIINKRRSGLKHPFREDSVKCCGVEFSFTDKTNVLFNTQSDIFLSQNILIGLIFKMKSS